ncbi:MAG: NADH-quinone oxidoreductase subunit L [Pantoea sp. Brub]|nr:NADH-quinone oxidoreductase subunit L [Pantoea sp. Brub]
MNLLYLPILFPLISFVLLSFSCGRLPQNISTVIGVGSLALSAIITAVIGFIFFHNNQIVLSETLWNWIYIGNFNITINLILDGLSLTMLSVVVGVGLLIQIFSSWYMNYEEGYSRFLAYTNLFIASMIILILADNLMVMYFGWECVGICSYLLIGFYYKHPKNGKAAIKAFITTRVGDVFLIIAMFIIYYQFKTLTFLKIKEIINFHLDSNHSIYYLANVMLLIGTLGKSAQLPLQTWLADAMVGPTPVSALIHSATMVTAGVYLIARNNSLFLINPEILFFISLIGAVTIILASCSALVQNNIKRILAYSTMSQIGYMFLALGVKAWSVAIFHLMIHSFFKALLFLSAGAVIMYCNNEQNIFKMGGLRKKIPFLYFCFLIGGSALSSLPLITAGFYSKEEILYSVFTNGNAILICIGLFGTLLTAIYTFRMIFIVFHGKETNFIDQINTKGIRYYMPLISLIVLSSVIGSFIIPPLSNIFPDYHIVNNNKFIFTCISSFISILGILISVVLYLNRPQLIINITNNILGRFLYNFWSMAWGFDWLYNQLFVKPYIFIASLLHRDPINYLIKLPILFLNIINKQLLLTESGYLRWYIISIALGSLIILTCILCV